MGGGGPAVEEARLRQQKRARTDRGQDTAFVMSPRQPRRKAPDDLGIGQTAEAWRHDDHRRARRQTGQAVISQGDARCLGVRQPMGDAQSRRVIGAALCGDAAGFGEQVGQAMDRGLLRPGIGQDRDFSRGRCHRHLSVLTLNMSFPPIVILP